MFRKMSGVFKSDNNVVLLVLVLAIRRTNRETRVKVNNNFASQRDALLLFTREEIERVIEELVAVRSAGTGAQPGAPDRRLRWRPQLMQRHALLLTQRHLTGFGTRFCAGGSTSTFF